MSVRLIRWQRAPYGVVLLDAVLGSIIAVASVAHQFSEVPFPGVSRLRDMTSFIGFSFATPGGIVLFALPAFLSTLVLASPFLRFLHGLDRPAAAHYRFGAAAGCVFGFVATAGTSFFLGAITAFLPGRDTTIWTRMAVLLGGPPFMAMSGGIAFSILFWKEILLAGAAFGLFNTWIARRMHQ
jgi:hypothetical protein